MIKCATYRGWICEWCERGRYYRRERMIRSGDYPKCPIPVEMQFSNDFGVKWRSVPTMVVEILTENDFDEIYGKDVISDQVHECRHYHLTVKRESSSSTFEELFKARRKELSDVIIA